MEPKRVVITGMGTVNPLGTSVDQFWNNLKEGKSGIGKISKFDTTDYPVTIAGEVKDFDPSDVLDRKEIRSVADFTLYALHSATQAMKDSQLGPHGEGGYDVERAGVYLGNGIGGFEVVEENHKKLFDRGPRAVAPLTIPKLIANEAAGNIAIKFGIKGPAHTVVTACASGTDAIGEAFRAIKWGYVDVAISGGTEGAITQLAVAGFSRLQALASAYNEKPEQASRPFDKDRDGFVMGEGAGILILEELEHALKRKAPIYAEVLGYGMTCDAYHLTAPDPEGSGAVRAMRAALSEASLDPTKIDYINAHGTSTQANDVMETKAIKQVFGEHAYTLKVSSTKSMTAHLIAAAGAVEAIATIMSIKDSFIHCTLNLEEADSECDLDYVPQQGISHTVDYALSESLGFGGHNGALVFGKYKG